MESSLVLTVDTSTNRVYWLDYTPELVPQDQWMHFPSEDYPFPGAEPVPGNGSNQMFALYGFPFTSQMPLGGFVSVRAGLPGESSPP